MTMNNFNVDNIVVKEWQVILWVEVGQISNATSHLFPLVFFYFLRRTFFRKNWPSYFLASFKIKLRLSLHVKLKVPVAITYLKLCSIIQRSRYRQLSFIPNRTYTDDIMSRIKGPTITTSQNFQILWKIK